MRNNSKVVLPMKNVDWNRIGVNQDGASLMSPLGLIEAEVFEIINLEGPLTLKDLVLQSQWPESMIMMSTGSLIRKGLIHAKRHNRYVYLEKIA